jgi:dTDP-4-dehydrorhamnose 3,5-epimerase-like enzyme
MNFDEIYWIDFHDNKDERGRLTAIEEVAHAPFDIKRIFYVHQVKPNTNRGGHAHIDTDQVITTVNGVLKVDISDGITTQTYALDSPSRGIFVPRMFWIRLYDFSDSAVCLVLASTRYNMKNSYRTWDDYLDARNLPYMDPPGGI